MPIHDIREAARDSWREILVKLAGVDPALLDGKGRACPICREGKDRFTFDDKEGTGTWLCRRCPSEHGKAAAAGGGMELLRRITGWDYVEAAHQIEEHLLLPINSVTPSPRRRSYMTYLQSDRRPQPAPITGPIKLTQHPKPWPDKPPAHLPQGFRIGIYQRCCRARMLRLSM